VLRITGVRRRDWCRNVASGSRLGPWKYECEHTVLDEAAWRRRDEVLYFVTDGTGGLRLAGQSSNRLADRWRMSPMHDVATRAPLGRKTLFHSTAWKAIEEGFGIEKPPFTVRALFRAGIERVCRGIDDASMLGALGNGGTPINHLAQHIEQMVLAFHGQRLRLWNRQGVRAAV